MNPLVRFPEGTREAVFLQRQKRFLVEVDDGGESLWIHTNNSGSMMGLLRPGQRVLMSPAANPKRKLPYTLEAVELGGFYCCVNTSVPNKMLYTAFEKKALPELAGATELRREARIGDSRLDARFSGPDGDIWVEAKNVTLAEYGVGAFPDAVTVRGQKHLQELMRLAAQGVRVATFYLISRADAECFGPADFIDEEYARLFYQALDAGVEAWPYLAGVSEKGVWLERRLEVVRP